MLVKEIIKDSATLIGREDIVKYLSGGSQSSAQKTADTVNTMVRLLNIVVNELAGSFIPMIVTERVNAVDGKVIYSELKFSPKEILNAFDLNGNDRLLSVEHSFARVEASVVDLEYSCFPPTVDINGSIEYLQMDVASSTLSYGLLAEYAISQGCFKDAVMWHDRYANAVNEQCKPKNAMIKRRSWL